MGIRFRKSIKLFPGVRLNFGSRGMSVSAGVRGARVTVGRKTTVSAGIPGTGLSASATVGRSRAGGRAASAEGPGLDVPPARPSAFWSGVRAGLAVLVVLQLLTVFAAMHWLERDLAGAVIGIATWVVIGVAIWAGRRVAKRVESASG